MLPIVVSTSVLFSELLRPSLPRRGLCHRTPEPPLPPSWLEPQRLHSKEWASELPGVWTPRHPSTGTSERPDIRASERPSVRASGCPSVRTSERSSIQASEPLAQAPPLAFLLSFPFQFTFNLNFRISSAKISSAKISWAKFCLPNVLRTPITVSFSTLSSSCFCR